MKNRSNRKAIVLSAVLTALILTIAGTAALASGWLPGRGQVQAPAGETGDQPPVGVTVQPLAGPIAQPAVDIDSMAAAQPDPEVIAAYQAQLDQAYQALREAYTQIDALQAAQSQPVQVSGREGEHEGLGLAGGRFHEEHDDD